jgi:hypothetical protein
MADYTLVDSDAAASELAGLLNGTDRVRPTVVVTIAAGQHTPYIDVSEVARELDGLADVYLIATGPHTWTFSQHMREGTQVYGGAGRAYPVGHDWVQDLSKSPLRFAWGKDEGPRTTQRLIDDGLDMAAAAGVLGSRAQSSRRVRRQGRVLRAENERAWVDLGGGGLDMGVVPPQLAAPDLPIERILQAGMAVSGVLDRESRWFDIRESRLCPEQALADYQIGDVVLAEIADVHGEFATARLLPSLTVKLGRADVTPDDTDLRTLLTPGEVVTARVLGTWPWWLTLLEVDEEPLCAASVYEGGPPWLLPPMDAEPEPEEVSEPAVLVQPVSQDIRETTKESALAPTTRVRPGRPAFSPAQMPGRRGERVRAAVPAAAAQDALTPVSGAAVRDLSLKVDELQARADTLESQLAGLREELKGVRFEREQLEALKSSAERRATRLEADLKKSRSALRRAASGQHVAAPAFADRERGFRHLVETAWARRIPVGEQLSREIPEYVVGDRFLDSVEALQGVTADKVADVAMELLTGIAESSAGRDMHRLRAGMGGDDPIHRRASDGAVCWRIALQTNTPSARRLHAWKLPDGRWELSSVRKHDDFVP